MTPDTFNKVALAVVAICAMFIGPFLQWRIARRQATDNVSAKRQNWIDELRKDMAELLTVMGSLTAMTGSRHTFAPENKAKSFERVEKLDVKARELFQRIELRLNPNEDAHNELVALLTKLIKVARDAPPHDSPLRNANDQSFDAARAETVAHMQGILKHEWERVKHGKI